MPARSRSAIDSVPKRSLTSAGAAPAPRARGIKRTNTTAGDGGELKHKSRKNKKGIHVHITVRKKETGDGEEEKPADSMDVDGGEDLKIYTTTVLCRGKLKRKGCWPDVNSFWQSKEIDKDIMCDLLDEYSQSMYPERKGAENTRPKRCYLRDEALRGISFYKDYDWDPVQLNLEAEKKVEVLESWTRNVQLESIPIDFSTDLETVLIEQGDKTVVSTLKKSKLQGHPLAISMMTSDTQIVTELRGLESVVSVFGNDEKPDDVDKETGESIWRDCKTLRALLYDKPFPKKEGKGTQRVVEVVALETYLKIRVNYSAYFDGDVVSDHGVGLLLGERWWAHPLKDIMMGFGQSNSAKIYEDIELRFFSEIGYKMENEYFDWENQGGKWVKVKKFRDQE